MIYSCTVRILYIPGDDVTKIVAGPSRRLWRGNYLLTPLGESVTFEVESYLAKRANEETVAGAAAVTGVGYRYRTIMNRT